MRTIANKKKEIIIFFIILLCMVSPGFYLKYHDLKDMPTITWCEGNRGSYGIYNYNLMKTKRREADMIMRNMNYLGDNCYLGHITDEKNDYRGIALYNSETGNAEYVLGNKRIKNELEQKAGGGGNDSKFFISEDGDRVYFHSFWLTICCFHRKEDRIEIIADSGGPTFYLTNNESFLYYADKRWRLVKKDLSNGDEEIVLERVNWFAVSEDGRYVAHMLTGGPLELYDTQTKESVVIRNRFTHKTVPVFSRDGEYLIYTDYDEAPLGGYAHTSVYVYNKETNRSHRVYKTKLRTNILSITWKEER